MTSPFHPDIPIHVPPVAPIYFSQGESPNAVQQGAYDQLMRTMDAHRQQMLAQQQQQIGQEEFGQKLALEKQRYGTEQAMNEIAGQWGARVAAAASLPAGSVRDQALQQAYGDTAIPGRAKMIAIKDMPRELTATVSKPPAAPRIQSDGKNLYAVDPNDPTNTKPVYYPGTQIPMSDPKSVELKVKGGPGADTWKAAGSPDAAGNLKVWNPKTLETKTVSLGATTPKSNMNSDKAMNLYRVALPASEFVTGKALHVDLVNYTGAMGLMDAREQSSDFNLADRWWKQIITDPADRSLIEGFLPVAMGIAHAMGGARVTNIMMARTVQMLLPFDNDPTRNKQLKALSMKSAMAGLYDMAKPSLVQSESGGAKHVVSPYELWPDDLNNMGTADELRATLNRELAPLVRGAATSAAQAPASGVPPTLQAPGASATGSTKPTITKAERDGLLKLKGTNGKPKYSPADIQGRYTVTGGDTP